MENEEYQHDYQECLGASELCSTMGLRVLTHALARSLDPVPWSPIRQVRDCADLCQHSSTFLSHGARLNAGSCDVVAEVCERTAAALDIFPEDDLMTRCAHACRRAGQSFRTLSRHAQAVS